MDIQMNFNKQNNSAWKFCDFQSLNYFCNTAWIAILLGLISFIYMTGGAILNPTYIDWLLTGDPATHWLGWQFFRNAPLLQWPLGANPAYGGGMGSSIVFTDSIPLFAFLFKSINIFLPDKFQYFGYVL